VVPNPPGPEPPIVPLPPSVAYPQNPIAAQNGAMQPPAAIPGAGSVWLLGSFPGLGWRWVAVDAGASVANPGV
jgi:hypothetical protein